MSDWQEISEFPGWLVDNEGRVMNEWTSRIMRHRPNQQGIMMVGIQKEGVQLTRSVATLVAKAFVHNPNPRHFDSIIYLNGDRADCRAFNLMWRSRPFALRFHRMFDQEPYRIAVRVPSTGEVFHSLRELCTTYGLIEAIAYSNMINRESCFPYSWMIEEWDQKTY